MPMSRQVSAQRVQEAKRTFNGTPNRLTGREWRERAGRQP